MDKLFEVPNLIGYATVLISAILFRLNRKEAREQVVVVGGAIGTVAEVVSKGWEILQKTEKNRQEMHRIIDAAAPNPLPSQCYSLSKWDSAECQPEPYVSYVPKQYTSFWDTVWADALEHLSQAVGAGLIGCAIAFLVVGRQFLKV